MGATRSVSARGGSFNVDGTLHCHVAPDLVTGTSFKCSMELPSRRRLLNSKCIVTPTNGLAPRHGVDIGVKVLFSLAKGTSSGLRVRLGKCCVRLGSVVHFANKFLRSRCRGFNRVQALNVRTRIGTSVAQ